MWFISYTPLIFVASTEFRLFTPSNGHIQYCKLKATISLALMTYQPPSPLFSVLVSGDGWKQLILLCPVLSHSKASTHMSSYPTLPLSQSRLSVAVCHRSCDILNSHKDAADIAFVSRTSIHISCTSIRIHHVAILP